MGELTILNFVIIGIISPFIFNHIFLFAITKEKINIYLALLSIGFIFYIVLFSSIIDYTFESSNFLLYLPIFELSIILFIIYVLNKIIYDNSIKIKNLNYYYLVIFITIVFSAIFVTVRNQNSIDKPTKISFGFFAFLILIGYFIIILINISTKKTAYNLKFFFILFLFFTVINFIGTIFNNLYILKDIYIYLPLLLFILSFNLLSKYIISGDFNKVQNHINNISEKISENISNDSNDKKVEFTQENNTEEQTNKILVNKNDELNKNILFQKELKNIINEKESEDEDIDFSSFIKNKINIYNELPDTFNKISKAIKDNIYLRTNKTFLEDFAYSYLSFVKTYQDPSNRVFFSLISENNSIYIASGDFKIETSNNITMDKIKLSNFKKSCEQIGGRLIISKSNETGLSFIRIIFENKISSLDHFATNEQENKVINSEKTIFIITDNPDTYRYISETTDSYDTIIFKNFDETLDFLVNNQKPQIIISAMTDDSDNETVYYGLERFKEFTNIPLILISNNKKPTYLDLKSYRLFPAEYIIRPIDKNELIEKIEKINDKIYGHKERNIKNIENKIEKTENENISFIKKFEDKANFYLLDDNEKKVILYLIKGEQYRDISKKLKISEEELIRRIDNLFFKLEIKTRVELIDLFVR